MRDGGQQKEAGSRDIRETAIHVFDLERVRAARAGTAAGQATEIFRKHQFDKFWIYPDADVSDDAIMPAVDYRLAGGLGWGQLSAALRALMASG